MHNCLTPQTLTPTRRSVFCSVLLNKLGELHTIHQKHFWASTTKPVSPSSLAAAPLRVERQLRRSSSRTFKLARATFQSQVGCPCYPQPDSCLFWYSRGVTDCFCFSNLPLQILNLKTFRLSFKMHIHTRLCHIPAPNCYLQADSFNLAILTIFIQKCLIVFPFSNPVE